MHESIDDLIDYTPDSTTADSSTNIMENSSTTNFNSLDGIPDKKSDNEKAEEKKPVAEFAEEGSDLQNKVFDKIPDKKIIEHIIETAQKTIKREDSLIKLILYTGLSTYTKDPLNLGIIAPTSEGKTYAVSEVIKFLPKQDVWIIGSMSPRVLIRDKGILVDEDNQPIEKKI